MRHVHLKLAVLGLVAVLSAGQYARAQEDPYRYRRSMGNLRPHTSSQPASPTLSLNLSVPTAHPGHHHHSWHHPPTAGVWTSPGTPLPRLGFVGYVVPGRGLYVTSVAFGSRAAAIGLEPRDIILNVNGVPMAYAGAYEQGLRQAWLNGGWVSLLIRDWRTGAVVSRSASLY